VIEIVGRDLPSSSPARAVVKDVRLEVAQINHILTDLLQTARPHPPEIRPSDLNTTVEHAIMLARQQVISKPIQIELHNDPTLPVGGADSDQIHRVLLNPLNAQARDRGDSAGRAIFLRGSAAISVTDTGRGIAPEHLPDLPALYTRRATVRGSACRGSPDCRRASRAIEVTSEVGKGTKSLIILPLARGKEAAASKFREAPVRR
jgi:signal transduction histidine kinase